MTAALAAYHNDPAEKAAILVQLQAHRLADQLVKGQYWEDGKGCAVGCTLHSGNHLEYEPRFGIPVLLARLEDAIFEGLPNSEAQRWPERFMGAITPGVDLSRVGWLLLRWLLDTPAVNPGIFDDQVTVAVKACVDVLAPLCAGRPVDLSAAESAAWSAMSAAWSAMSAAESAAWSAMSAARSAAWIKIADKLIELIEQAAAEYANDGE